MGQNAAPRPRMQSRPGPIAPATYWRRRVVALALGIGLIGLCAWAVNETLGGPPASGEALVVATVPASGATGGHPGAHSTGQAHSPGSRPSGSSTGSPRSSPSPSAGPSRSAASSRSPGTPQSAGPGTPMPAPCAGKDVVLSLSSRQYWYKAGRMPTFTVDVVSTATRQCGFNVGSRFLSVVVSAGGQTRIWSSSDCTHSTGSRTVVLARGVPEVLQVTWDRKTSSPGCKLARRTVQPGAFTATVVSGRLRSQPKIFVLGAPGVAVP